MSASMKPVLFLDIDGVLNSEAWYRRRPKGPWTEAREIDPQAFFLLRAVVAMSDCEIVVSSSWRLGRTVEELQRLLQPLPVIGKTPELTTGKTRGAEIDLYLSENPGIPCYAIVDDGGDFYEHQRMVRTDWKLGMTPADADELVTLLKQSH